MTLDAENSIDDRVTLRPVVIPDDEGFLRELYFTSREDLDGFFSDENQMLQLLMIQYNGQTLTYGEQFPDAAHEIVLLDGEPVGRTIIDRRPDVIYIVDFAILPGTRNLGIGTAVFARLFKECSESDLPMVLHVLKTNRARELYERLGFQTTAENATHFFMKWNGSEGSQPRELK